MLNIMHMCVCVCVWHCVIVCVCTYVPTGPLLPGLKNLEGQSDTTNDEGLEAGRHSTRVAHVWHTYGIMSKGKWWKNGGKIHG